MKKIVLMLCSLIPLCLQVPYLLNAWRTSRLDQWDWLFYLLAIPAFLWACRKEKIEKCDWWALLLLVPALFLALTPFLHKVNALAVASSAVCIYSAVWLIASWRFAYRISPAIMILLLGTPSSSYGISLLLMSPVWAAWMVKFLLAALSFGWIFCNKRFDFQLKKGTICFLAVILASCFLMIHSKDIYFEGKTFVPEFTRNTGDFWGRRIEPDEKTKRFFVSSTVRQFRYTRANTDVSVLAVKCGADIHEIHPASHCLRTSFWTIHSEKTLYLQDNFAVTEIDAEKGPTRCLIWVWYSSNDFSTPGFLGFRRHFRVGGDYYTYQISTAIHEDIQQSRKVLQEFIQSLKHDDRIAKRGTKQ